MNRYVNRTLFLPLNRPTTAGRRQEPYGLALKKRDWRYIRELAYYSSLGLQVALSIFIGFGVGRYLDNRFDTDPWMTVVFFLLGVAAAVRNLGLAIKKIRKF